MNARNVMTMPVLTVSPSTPLKDAVGTMLQHRVSGLPVVDAGGRLLGIVTEADLLLKEAEIMPEEPGETWLGGSLWLERLLSGHAKLVGRTVGEVMTHNVITALEETSVHVLAARMVHFKVKRLPIVRGTRVVGIVTRADILKAFLKPDQALLDEAHQLLRDFPLAEESVQVSIERGVLLLKGRVRSSDRRATLMRRLEDIDGVIAVDDHALEDQGAMRARPTE